MKEDIEEATTTKTKRKPVMLKQWYIFAEDITTKEPFRLFMLATCGKKAREAFLQRYPDKQILQVL